MDFLNNFNLVSFWFPRQTIRPGFDNCLSWLEFTTLCCFSGLLLNMRWDQVAIRLGQEFVFVEIHFLKFCNDSHIPITIRRCVCNLSLEWEVLMILKSNIHFEQLTFLFSLIFKCKLIVKIHVPKIFFYKTTIALILYIIFISKR